MTVHAMAEADHPLEIETRDPVLEAIANAPMGRPLTDWERGVIHRYETRRAAGTLVEVTTEEFCGEGTHRDGETS